MKKVLSLVLVCIVVAILTGGFLVFQQYRKNPEQLVPYPYDFQTKATALTLEAPILVTGDQMGVYLAKFQTELAETISSNLSAPIKIQSLAKAGNGLHRTLHELKAVVNWPKILIYQGASEEFKENRFELSEETKIRTNFERYKDDRLETLIILYPWLSRIIFEPIKRVHLAESPQLIEEISENEYLKRLEMELLLYEQQLIQLINLAKENKTLLILTTTPINLEIAPKKVCDFTRNVHIDKAVLELRELLENNDPKTAYGKSSKLIKQVAGNAQVFYLHGQIAKRLGLMEEARKSLLEASAYDCEPWRASEVYNSIIRRVAKANQVLLFDFAQLVEKDWNSSTAFFDDLHPQNLYYERGMQQLGLVIKDILKL